MLVYREMGVMLRAICNDFIEEFCFVSAINVPFFSLQVAFMSDSMPRIGQSLETLFVFCFTCIHY